MPDDSSRPVPEAPQVEGREEAPPPPPRRRRRWLRPLLLVLGPLLVAAAGGYAYVTGGRFVETDNAYVKADTVAITAEVSGRIAVVDVEDNQAVAAGQTLFRIDDRSYRVALAKAEAQLRGVAEEIDSLKAAYRQQAQELKLARTDVDYAQREYDRQASLAGKSIVSQSKLDESHHNLDAARQRINVIEQEMAQTRARLGGDPDAPVTEHARYLEAQAVRDEANLDLERTVVRAPFAGIASRTPEVGQHLTSGMPVMSVVADADTWVEANFKETDLTYVRPGQAAEIRVDAYPDRVWHGTVESISQATGAEFSVIPPQNATGNWVKVVQRIPLRIVIEPKAGDPPLRAGMSATAEVDSGHNRLLPGFLQTAVSWLGLRELATANAAEAAEQGR